MLCTTRCWLRSCPSSPGTAATRGGSGLAVRGNHHFHHDGRAIFVGIQRRQIRGQPLGQHREDFGGGVNRGRVALRMLIQRRARGNQRVDVGDRHQDFGPAVWQFLGHGQLVEIARVVVVDRAPEQRALIPPTTGAVIRCVDGGQLL
jgi:hypothetical protein